MWGAGWGVGKGRGLHGLLTLWGCAHPIVEVDMDLCVVVELYICGW